MSRRKSPLKSVRVYARITPELHTLLQQVRVAKRFETDADLMRAALRAYLDEQSDQVASKRHFSASMQRRMNRVEWHLTVITYLIAQACSLLIAHATGQKLQSDVLLEQAIRMAVQKRQLLSERLDDGWTKVEAAERQTR
jgi:Arc/MetJ-type ribon-helix-helix transcriptional regulator